VDNSSIEDSLDRALELFDRRPDSVETGLEVDDPEMVQLRKACRLLEAGRRLNADNGYYTLVIEAAFAATERTLQFYLIENGFLEPEEYVDHQEVYERSSDAGLFSEDFVEKLEALWRDNRSRSYYREGVGSEARANEMLELAEQIHDHVLQLAGRGHLCICDSS
jgi:hypothetical protein